MKRLCFALTAAVLAFGVLHVSAGEGDKGGDKGGAKGDKPRPKRPEPGKLIKTALDHAADLKLTDEQKAQLEELLKNMPKPPADGQKPPKDGGPGQGGDANGPKMGGDGGEKHGPPEGGHKDGPPEGKGPPDGKKPADGQGGGDKMHGPRDNPLAKILNEEQMAKLKEIMMAEHGGPGGDKGGPGGDKPQRGGDKGGDHPDHPKGPPPGEGEGQK